MQSEGHALRMDYKLSTSIKSKSELNLILLEFYGTETSGGSINRKLDCSARFGPSSDQSNLPSIARSLPSDNENKHDETAAILKDTFDRQDTL